MDSSAHKILVVDDDQVGRFLMVGELEKHFSSVSQARSAEDMLELLKHQRFDVIVLDINLPGIDGLTATETIREHSDIGIIQISVIHDLKTKLRALQSGADDFLVKPVNFEELTLKVRTLGNRVRKAKRRSGESIRGARVCNALALIESSRSLVTHQGNTQTLTAGETAILKLLINQAGNPCSRDDLLTAICESELPDSTARTVDTLVSRIRSKMRTLDACGQCIQTQRNAGYLLDRRSHQCSTSAPAHD